MKTLNLTLVSKNINSFKNFLVFINKKNTLNINLLCKYFRTNLKKTKFNILKSPHVNKIAQEQFEIKTFKQVLKIQSLKNFYFLIFLKKLSNSLLFDIYFKFYFSNKADKNVKKQIINLNNFKLKKNSTCKLQNLKLFKKICDLIKILELKGEFFMFIVKT